jgi:riboflavin kinase/FMN adenylyltransferase
MPTSKDWIQGKAVPGDRRGTALGFPTANIALDESSRRPDDGIYACWAKVGQEHTPRPAVLHVGPRPTFPGASPTVELHILRFPYAELYGRILSFTLVKRLRGVEKFDSVEKLRQAMQQDCTLALKLLC